MNCSRLSAGGTLPPVAIFLFLVMAPVLPRHQVAAETVILHNQADQPVAIRFGEDVTAFKPLTLPVGASVPVSVTGAVDVWFNTPKSSGRSNLWPDNIYRFSTDAAGRVGLNRVPLGKPQTTSAYPKGELNRRTPMTLRIKIAVDDDERTKRETWEKKIRARIEAASRLLEYYCGVRLEVVAIARWESKDSIRDFNLSLSEFTAKVPARPAELVIGFTSQYDVRSGRQRLGATRGPLRSHILIREHGPRIGESERLEVLLHELGHYFGAAHSPNRKSLMRPILGDDQSNARSFQLAYDPMNLLVMNLVADQLRRPDFYSVGQIPLRVQQRLLDAYNWLAKAQPADRSARDMSRVLCRKALASVPRSNPQRPSTGPSAEEIRRRTEFRRAVMVVLRSLGRVAGSRSEESLNLDRLTNAYVRAAAAAAAKVDKEYAIKAFYFALAIALDRGYLSQRYEPISVELNTNQGLVSSVSRELFVGNATIHRRTSLLQDFISAGLLAQLIGNDQAIEMTTQDEIDRARETVGFSFAALVANRAGIRLNQALVEGEITLQQLAETFKVQEFVPSVADFRKFWTSAQLEEDFGGTDGKYFQKEVDAIQNAVDRLPVYQNHPPKRSKATPLFE